MEHLDPNNPNLDGDFKALIKVLKGRPIRQPLEPADEPLDEEEEIEPQSSAPFADFKKHDSWETLRKELFKAVESDDTAKCQEVCTRIQHSKKSLSDAELRDPANSATALHRALQGGQMAVARFLIQNAPEEDLMQELDVAAGKLTSKKTCLHLLAERQEYLELAEIFLDRLRPGETKAHFLRQAVLMEPAGQRPRPLPAIHIAALNGNTKMVEVLVKLGVDVNHTNNKHDTAVLWAARGNHIETVRRLIQLGADLHHQNDKGSTPLYWGVRYGFSDLVRVLVTEGRADIHQNRKLGLVSPIVLAAALGYDDILQILLSHGGEVNTRITNNQTALHFAALYGHDTVVETLLKSRVTVDQADDAGNTALLLAVKAGHVEVIETLVRHGANIDCRNKQGQTTWSFGMETDDTVLLRTLVRLYRQVKRMRGRKLVFPQGRTPLHVAALAGDVDKIQCLFTLGTDPKCLDQNHNTFLHVAARENHVEVLRNFLSDVDVSLQNNDGDTPLHLAASQGHAAAAQVLIPKSKLNITNGRGYTALHAAAWSGAASPEVIRLLVDTIVKNNNWSLVDARDVKGNTALHIAAYGNRAEIIGDLNQLNPSLLNKEGNNPLHVAASEGHAEVLAAMLEVFNKQGHGLDIDQQNGEGETLMHICAKLGDVTMVETLVATGADLAKKNDQGNTVLHELAEQLVLEPHQLDKLLDVYDAIQRCTALWWCICHELPHADEGSDVYRQYRRQALFYLTSDVYNHTGYNALAYSVAVGAMGLFKAILETKDVYKRRSGKSFQFDITNITPDTITSKVKTTSRKESAFSNQSTVGVIEDKDLDDEDAPNNRSCLEIIAYGTDDVMATQFLDIVPVRQLVQDLWARYQWIYLILMVWHIAYMVLFTEYSVPLISQFYGSSNDTSQIAYTSPPTMFPISLFIMWPMLLMIFQVIFVISAIRQWSKESKVEPDGGKKSHDRKSRCCADTTVTALPGKAIEWIFSHLSNIATVLFVASQAGWLVLHSLESKGQIYPLVLCHIVGWLFTIVFTKGFESVHAFSIMLTYIIIRDIVRFVFIYIFVLTAFAVGIHCCLMVVPSLAAFYPSVWHTIFVSFNLMIGMGDILDENLDQSYNEVGGNAWFVRFVYLFYITLSTVILLNLLIAMLSDTYNDIKSKEGTTWRVGSVRLALRIERSAPFIRRLLTRLGIIKDQVSYDPDTRRWQMALPMEQVQEDGDSAEVSEIMKVLQRLEHRLDVSQNAFHELGCRVDTLLEATVAGGVGGPSSARDARVTPGGDGSESPMSHYGRQNRRRSMAVVAARPLSAKRHGRRRKDTIM